MKAYFKNRGEWRIWLERNHSRSEGITLVFYKRHTGKPGMTYPEALEEALAYGWIDSTLRRIDDEKHSIKFTPRKKSSVWSLKNRRTAEKLIKEGRMMPAGYAAIEEGKKRNLWQKAYTNKKRERMPSDLKRALMEDKKAWINFNLFANSYRNMYIGWVMNAKTKETKERRIKEVVKRSLMKKKPGM